MIRTGRVGPAQARAFPDQAGSPGRQEMAPETMLWGASDGFDPSGRARRGFKGDGPE
jgi:hypothetical protein